ncbi:MAG: universal stress protein [Alphaproteobacteria bacterium]
MTEEQELPIEDQNQDLDTAEIAANLPADAERIFLVVVDGSDEMSVALRFASRRAEHTNGRVALAYVVEPNDFGHWLGVDKLMQEEAREEAEQVLQRQGAVAQELTGKLPVLYLRFGNRRDEIIQLIDEEPSISIMVLASAPGSKNPGPLISDFSSKFLGKLRVPITIVPGDLTIDQVDAIS